MLKLWSAFEEHTSHPIFMSCPLLLSLRYMNGQALRGLHQKKYLYLLISTSRAQHFHPEGQTAQSVTTAQGLY